MHALEAQLRKQVATQAEEISSLKEQVKNLEAAKAQLEQEKQYLLRRMFGKKSEALDSRQLELMLGLTTAGVKEEPKVIPLPAPARPRRRRVSKARLPEDLPTEEIIIDPEEVRKAPEAYRQIGEEITVELDVIRPRYFKRLYIRRKYVSRTDRTLGPLIAPMWPRLIEGGYASAGLVADIALKKYMDHLPLHRQEQILRVRFGIELPRKTMCEWIRVAADWVRPIYEHLRTRLRESGYLQIDETPVRYCQGEGGGSRKGYFWVYHHPPSGTVLYEWHTGRGADCLDEMLKEFKGTIQSDGYRVYPSYAKDKDTLQLAACWAHARRKFFEAQDEAAHFSSWILNQIGHLYRIESELRARKAGPALRAAVRSADGGMILSRIRRALECKQLAHLPQGKMGKAISYTLGLWSELLRFRDDGRLEIDNNGVENAIRPTAVGKKNWLFVGHPDAGDRSAILYTLIENCRRLGINPEEYLRDVLTRLPSMTNQQTHELTPSNWLAARKARAA